MENHLFSPRRFLFLFIFSPDLYSPAPAVRSGCHPVTAAMCIPVNNFLDAPPSLHPKKVSIGVEPTSSASVTSWTTSPPVPLPRLFLLLRYSISVEHHNRPVFFWRHLSSTTSVSKNPAVNYYFGAMIQETQLLPPKDCHLPVTKVHRATSCVLNFQERLIIFDVLPSIPPADSHPRLNGFLMSAGLASMISLTNTSHSSMRLFPRYFDPDNPDRPRSYLDTPFKGSPPPFSGISQILIIIIKCEKTNIFFAFDFPKNFISGEEHRSEHRF